MTGSIRRGAAALNEPEAAPYRALFAKEGCERRVETHLSHVFLCRDRVLKLKKARALPFVDFSSCARREAACRRELAVNRAFAPELYLGLRPIWRRGDGGVALGARLDEPAGRPLPQDEDRGETIIDWVVEMRRFPDGAEFDRLAERAALTPPLIRALADRVAAVHLRTPAAPRSELGAAPVETIAQIEASLAATTLAPATARWAAAAGREAARRARLIAARRRHGFPRRLHGDLHLGNICLLDGAPTPFDAIEFDEAIATVDPLYDVAFTAMDLLWRGERALAQAFLSRYLSATRDYGGLAAWPLFLSLRAAIRAMTAALAGDEALAEEKLRFASRLLELRPEPRLVAVAGLSGTGKTRLATTLAPALSPLGDAVSIASDVTRKRLFGVAPETRLPESAYAPETHARVYRRLARDARRALRAGAGVVLEGVFGRPQDRRAAAAIAADLGLPFAGFALAAPLETRLARVAARARTSDGDASDADVAVAAAQEGGAQEDGAPTSSNATPLDPGWTRLDAAGAPEDVAACALRRLGGGAAPSIAPYA